ncbi:hypothetical protein [Streptomyces sp. NBC_01373]|uniref:hypothetical protein n=1 Tax=Streptomyces sp. NBC_01373 TaxID=2903843 RepID=UPI002251F61F|nr:hypothetical protein [Streptomyces sp. NBC_01373]
MLELLALPRTSGLSDPQRRGTACVWCAVTLAPETARDLGARPGPGGGQIFPRGCPGCLKVAALQEYGDHTGSCEQCVDDPALCSTRRSLRRLAFGGLG